MTDRDRYSLRGPARLCAHHRTWYARACGPDACETEERSDVTIVEFRPDGLLQRRYYRNPPPHLAEWTSYYEYDKESSQLSVERVEEGGKVTFARLLEYDSEHRLLRVTVTDRNGDPRVAESYSYDHDGKKKTSYIDPDLPQQDACCGPMFGVEGTDAGYAAPGARVITSIYDGNNRPIEHLFHDSNGELVSRIDLRYDDRGNLVEEVCTRQKLPVEITAQLNEEQLEAMRKLFVLGRRHHYDGQNRRIETSSIAPADDRDKTTFAYNDKGDVISEISESSRSEYDLEERGTITAKPDSTRSRRSETRIRYQYDTHGNWTEKIVETPGGPVWSVDRRTILYFDDTTPQ
jgi:hypothetical protein